MVSDNLLWAKNVRAFTVLLSLPHPPKKGNGQLQWA